MHEQNSLGVEIWLSRKNCYFYAIITVAYKLFSDKHIQIRSRERYLLNKNVN